MAINKKLIHFDMTKQLFMSNANGLNNLTKPTNGIVGNIPYYSVVFLKDGYIWTHGHFINGTGIADSVSGNATISWSKITDKPSTFTPSAHTQAYTTLTGSGTTANQAIVSSGTANGWTLKTLGSRAFDNTNYLPLTGGTMSGTAVITFADSGNWGKSNEGVTFPLVRGGFYWSGQSDWISLKSIETANDNLDLVLQFGDDNSNGLSVRNKDNTQVARINASGIISAASFVKNGGLSSQFLKADGSIDSTAYLPLSGGTMTGIETISSTSAISFSQRTSYGTRADYYTSGNCIHGGEDHADQDGANVQIGTWYGFGIYPTISGQTRTQGKNSFWHNARTGNTYTWGEFYSYDGSTNRKVLHEGNSSVSKSGETLTVKINGTSQSLTNTWRGIQNNLTSSSTTDSLSAYQGHLLANGSARDNTKLPLSGGSLSGYLTVSGGSSHAPLVVKGGLGGYRHNIQLIPASNWSGILFGANDVTGEVSSTTTKSYWVGNNDGKFSIAKNGSGNASVSLYCDGTDWHVNTKKIIHAGNIGSQSVNYAASAGNADTVDNYHAFDIGKAGWIDVGSQNPKRYYKVAKLKLKDTWSVTLEVDAAGDLNYCNYSSGKLFLSCYYSSSLSVTLLSNPSYVETIYAYIDSEFNIWLAHDYLYSGMLRWKCIQNSANDTARIELYTPPITSQTTEPSSYKITANGSYHYYNSTFLYNGGIYNNSNNASYPIIKNCNLDGNASTATKATQDSDGSQINTTYLKRSGGTMTGGINMGGNSITNLGISGGIYWNPYVESASDGSDAASIRVVTGGVAGGTTLVISQMNDSQDTIQFVTNGSANLYHNSNKIWDAGNDGSGSGLDADLLDGCHENSFLRHRVTTYTNQEGTLWSQLGLKQYNGALPDSLSGTYNWGQVVSFATTDARFEIYASHLSSDNQGLYYRSGWDNDKKPWRHILDSYNSSVGKSGETLTVTINGTEKSLTNTWRGITNTYNTTSASNSISLSQLGAYNMYDNLTFGRRWYCNGDGTNGWCLVAEFDTSRAYINKPITFEFSGRGLPLTHITVQFANSGAADPNIELFGTDCAKSFGLYKAGTSKWQLYGQDPSSVWQNLELTRVYGNTEIVTIKMERVASIPDGIIPITTYIGNVGYATKATQDSDGKAINATYLKRSGGTMTGNITIGNSTFYASGTNGGINSLAVADDCILGDCNIGGHLGLKSLNTATAGISFYNSSGGSLGRFTVNSNGTPTWNDTAFSLTNHNHDATYFKHCSSNNTDPITGLYNGYGVCMTTTSGINSNWWHVFSAGWSNTSDWISQLALPTQDTTRGAWFRIRQSSTNSAWVRLHDTQNTYVSGNKGYINNTEITYVNTAGNADTIDDYHANNVYKAASYAINNPYTSNTWIRIATITIPSGVLGSAGFTAIFSNRECLEANSFILTLAIRHEVNNNSGIRFYYNAIQGLVPDTITIRSDDGITFYVYIKSSANAWTTYYNVTKLLTEGNITYENQGTTSPISGTKTNVNASKGGNVLLADSATKLQTARTLWGQSFDGTGNVNGNMSSVGTISASGDISITNTTAVQKQFKVINSLSELWMGVNDYGETFLWTPSNNSLILGTNNKHSIDILASGNVGIGTTTPSYKLDVNGTLHASGATTLSSTLYVGNNATIAGTLGVYGTTTLKSATTITANAYISGETFFSAVDAFRLNYGSYGVIHRNDGGSYWILLTNKNDQNGGFNSLRPFHIDFSTGTVHMDNNAIIDNLAFTQCNISMGGRVNATWGYDLNTSDYYGLYFKSKNSSSTGILFNDDGNVGINTTSPSYKLDVNGTLRVSDTITATSLAADYKDTWNDGTHAHPWYGYDLRYANTGVYSTTISDYFGMTLKTKSGNISITNGGNVGIGTFAPLRKLHVIGEAIFGESGYVATQGTGSGYSGTWVGQGFMELSAPNPYIDFHANKSTADFTSRLIQWSDKVRLLYVSSDGAYNGYILTCEGNHHNPVILGIFDLKRSGPGSTIWTLDNICGPCVFTLANNWGSNTTFDSHTYWTIPSNLLRVEINGILGDNYATKTTVKAAACIGTVMTRWMNNQPVVSNRSHEDIAGCSVECLCTDKAPGTNLYYDSNSPGKYIYITGAKPYGYDEGTNGLSMDQFRSTGHLSYLRVRFVVYGWLE